MGLSEYFAGHQLLKEQGAFEVVEVLSEEEVGHDDEPLEVIVLLASHSVLYVRKSALSLSLSHTAKR